MRQRSTWLGYTPTSRSRKYDALARAGYTPVGASGSTNGTQLFHGMVEQFVSGDGASGAASLAADESPAVKADAIKFGQVFVHTPGLPNDVRAAISKVISLLQAPPSAIKAAARGGNIKLYLLGGAGLVAAWFLFIRK